MKILNQWETERPGNETLLRFNLSIIQEWDEISLQLKTNHDGWSGNSRETRSVVLNPNDVSQGMLNRIVEYINDYSAYEREEKDMLNTVAVAINNIGFDRGDLWFKLSEALIAFVEDKEMFDL